MLFLTEKLIVLDIRFEYGHFTCGDLIFRDGHFITESSVFALALVVRELNVLLVELTDVAWLELYC